MSLRPSRIRETRGAARKRLARALALGAVALAVLTALACGYGEPTPAPTPEPPAVSSPVASAARTPTPAPSPTPTPEPKIDRSQAALVRVGETVAGEIETHGGFDQGNRILSILEYLTQLNIAKIDNSLGKSEFIG